MSQLLKLNTARNRVFSFIGVSITSLSVTISKDGGGFAAPAGSLIPIAGNFFLIALSTTDTDTIGDLAYRFTDSVLGDIAPNGDNVDYVGAPDVTLADGVQHGGTSGTSTATLALQSIDVSSAISDAVTFFSSAGTGLVVSGTAQAMNVVGGPGPGINVSGGNTTPGIQILGGTSGIDCQGDVGISVVGGQGNTGTGDGLFIVGSATRNGVFVGGDGATTANSNGHGITAVGGVNAGGAGISAEGHGGGAGMWMRAVNDSGGSSASFLITVDTGNAPAIRAVGFGTGAGMELTGGGINGNGLFCLAGGGSNQAGILSKGDGTGDGIDAIAGNTSGFGLFLQGNGTRAGLLSLGGATGNGATFQGGGTSGAGIRALGSGASAGIDVQGGATGAGVKLRAGTGAFQLDAPLFWDSVVMETGLNARQGANLCLAALAGVLTGANTTTITIKGAGVATTRIVATVDSFGDRSALTLTPPP
jgi:hypothetical protein